MSTKFNAFAIAGAAFAAALPAVPAQAAPLPEWYGRYVWEENVGRHGGSAPGEGIVAFITYTLSIGPGNGATGCTLNGQGFQTNKRILCTATPQGNSVIVKFYKFGPDNMFGSYRMGAPLFTLTRGPGGLTTRLAALTKSSDSTPTTGRLFRKVA